MPTRSSYIDIGDDAPDFTADTTSGEVSLHDYIDGSWALLTTHPRAFTPVCSTELIAEARRMPALAQRGVRAITVSEGTVEDHRTWSSQLATYSGVDIDFPIVADSSLEIGEQYGLLRVNDKGRVALTRTAILIDPTKKVRWRVTYPQGTGRNVDEILRVIDSLHLYDRDHVVTPADWEQGDPVLVIGDVTLFDADSEYENVESGVPYLNFRKPVTEGASA